MLVLEEFDGKCLGIYLNIALYIYIYSLGRCFYSKRLTIEEYNKRYIIKRQTDTGSACNTNF